MVERVDEALKGDIMHWAAFYVSLSLVTITRRTKVYRSYACDKVIKRYTTSRRGWSR